MESTSRITALNVLNVIAYVANVLIVYGIGVGGLIDGLPTNAELSEKYQTLITPIGWSFSIWGVIFISQFIFALVQLFAPFRSHPLVVSGVKRTYIGVCLAQIGWTLAFSYEIIWLSLTAMLLILSLLITILMAQYKIVDVTVRDYILLKFPFAIHAGWIVAASFVNGSVLLVDRNTGDELQYYTALGSLLAILLIAALALSISRPEYVVPLVLSWASVRQLFQRDYSSQKTINPPFPSVPRWASSLSWTTRKMR